MPWHIWECIVSLPVSSIWLLGQSPAPGLVCEKAEERDY